MAHLLDWKDILRPIRDGYRHLFPAPDTGPTPAEREHQRELDRLKGFAYFDTFETLEAWTEADSDPLQRANTPLLPRCGTAGMTEHMKANVLLCHDYAGNYHNYEAVQGIGVNGISYACEYLQFVETFVYFSHKLVCVPPPSWTNTMHRNGVSVLGTVLVEPQTKDTGRLLENYENIESPTGGLYFPVAEKLAAIAKHFGFDGWLINIEKTFAKDSWNADLLESFLRQLRKELGPESRLIWYDAITTANKVDYQNALTEKNLPFSKACGSIFTNYCWKESYALDSKQLAAEEGINLCNVFFGIDVWAQNSTKLTHPRITYPEVGGGGTQTGVAVAKLGEIGLSAAIFAPAWTLEHFPSHGRLVEEAVWDGRTLSEDLNCPCGKARQRHPENRSHPITKHAREFPAGSENFFFTDFSPAFGYHREEEAARLYDGRKLHSQLSSQSILPHLHTSMPDECAEHAINVLSLATIDEHRSGLCHLVANVQSQLSEADTSGKTHETSVLLYRLNMPADGSLTFRAPTRFRSPTPGARASYYFKFKSGTRFTPIEESPGYVMLAQSIVSRDRAQYDNDRLLEIGIHLKAHQAPQQQIQFLEVASIFIGPNDEFRLQTDCHLGNIRLERRMNLGKEHWRLCWDFSDGSEAMYKDAKVPYSDITGPVSHFELRFEDAVYARVYATEWILSQSSVEQFAADGGTTVVVRGVGFDGVSLAEEAARLHIDVM